MVWTKYSNYGVPKEGDVYLDSCHGINRILTGRPHSFSREVVFSYGVQSSISFFQLQSCSTIQGLQKESFGTRGETYLQWIQGKFNGKTSDGCILIFHVEERDDSGSSKGNGLKCH